MDTFLAHSEYITLIVTAPESAAETIRDAMGRAGAGNLGNYSHCSFSTKGIGRFMPNDQASPYRGQAGQLEEVVEERIETVCLKKDLEKVIAAIKEAHPYECTMIDIYPVYRIGCKL